MITAAMAALCVLTFCLVCFIPGSHKYAYAPFAYKILAPEETIEESIPDYAGKSFTYFFTVPDGAIIKHGARLSIWLEHTMAEVWLDGELQYSTKELPGWHIGKTPGKYWLSAAMRSDYAGKTVKIRLTPVYKSIRIVNPQFLLIQHGDLLTLIVLPKDKYFLTAALVVSIAGVFLALTTLFLHIDRINKQRLFGLGTLSFFVGLWKLTELPFTTLFLDIYGLHREIWYIGALSWLMLPMMFNLLCDQRADAGTQNRMNSDPRSFVRWTFVNAGLLLSLNILQLLNIADIYETMPVYGMTCAIGSIWVLMRNKPNRKEFLWLITFPAALAADILTACIGGDTRWAVFVLTWAGVNLCFRAAGFISDAIEREHLLYKQAEELRDVKVRAMMQQIRPHFIYNTLTSIYVLCREDPGQAMEVIDNFTTYLQSNFSAITASELISFSDELHHTKAYLAVEAIRYGEKLTVSYDLRHTAFRLPPLTLQPLVENAVKHGVVKGHFPEQIRISTKSENHAAIITVEDDGPGFDPSAIDEESHVGIRNVRDRLEMMCDGTLEIYSKPEHGTVITVKIPEFASDAAESLINSQTSRS